MIVVVTTADYFTHGDNWGRGAWLPGELRYLPELLSAITLICVLVLGSRDRFRDVRPIYWLVFGAIVVVMSFGALANSSEAGEVFTGIRAYARALPFFLLPCVFHFSDRQIDTQLKVLLTIAVLQLPIALEQRMKTAASVGNAAISGDYTSGTLSVSSMLSIFLICGLCLCAAFFIRGRLRSWQFLVLVALLFVPTTINETKGTLLLLPIGLLTTFMVGVARGFRLRAVVWLMALLALSGTLYWVAYDYLGTSDVRERTLGGWFTDEGRRDKLFTKETELGGDENAGRWDAVTVPVKFLSKDPVHLLLGLGIGSVADSSLGAAFVGRYQELFDPFLRSMFPRLLLELGLVGVGLVASLYLLIFSDSRHVAARNAGTMQSVALGWTGVTVVMGVSIFYKDMIPVTALSYLFWYFSGLVVAARMRLHHDRPEDPNVVFRTRVFSDIQS